MELVNRTALAAELVVSEIDPELPRPGMIMAKATFRYDGAGGVELETQDPLPLLFMDQETPLGLVPRDDLPRRDADFDVLLLGSARAPGGTPVAYQDVELRLDSASRALRVFGDRHWLGSGPGARISAPEPFEAMPLTWSRAYGGSAEVLIDRESPLTLSDPINPEGLGFTPEPAVEQLRTTFACPEGYPTWHAQRPLPNLEDPYNPIQAWSDAPPPVCWATLPMHMGLHATRFTRYDERADEPVEFDEEQMLHRAHPDWVLPRPPEAAQLRLQGVDAAGPVELRLPRLRVFADYEAGSRSGSLELVPQTLLVLADAQVLCLVYRALFSFEFEPETARSMRLRTEEGWCPPARGDAGTGA